MNQEREIPRSGERYLHFKGNYYQILAVAEHVDTGELLVIYQALYGEFRIFARPWEEFMSPVDKEKYPEVKQKYRFEKVTTEKVKAQVREYAKDLEEKTGSLPSVTENGEVNEDLVRFLDMERPEDKREFLMELKTKNRLSLELLMAMAASLELDVTGNQEEMFQKIRESLSILAKYEIRRNFN